MLSSQEFHALCNQTDLKVLEATASGPKIFETPHGEIIKLFRRKKGFSSNRFNPYAHRFCHNVKRLNELGFVAPKINALQYCPELKIHLVYYNKIPGDSFNFLARNNNAEILSAAISLVSNLHNKGVYFRAVHLGNLLQQADGAIALIDVADMKFKKNALSLFMRYRNLKHLFSYKDDCPLWSVSGMPYWLEYYGELSGLPSYQIAILRYYLSRYE